MAAAGWALLEQARLFQLAQPLGEQGSGDPR
jgi:hypothetical protein